MPHFPTSRWLSVWVFLLATCCLHAQVTVQVGLNFIGSSYETNSQAAPPDASGAIGPAHYLEFVNGSVTVYNRTNGAVVQRKTDLKFWSDAGLIISPDSAVSDPRVIYDPVSQRWFATQVDFNTTAPDPTVMANDFLLAVSTTANPAGPWKAFLFQADPDNGFFADFPTLGLDGSAVYISGDFYNSSVGMGPGLVSIPKVDLIAATPTVMSRHWYGVMDYATHGDVLQPAVCFDGSVNGSILAMGDIGSDSNAHSNVVWFAVQNAGSISPTLTAPASLTVSPYAVPYNVDLGVPQFTALQPDGTTTLQANDPRLSAKTCAVGGVLYAVHNTEINGRIAIRWYRIRAADHALLEQGTIADANLDLFFPSIAANQYGVVVIGCNGSGSGNFISSYAYAGQTVNGHTAFGSRTLLKAGVANYHDVNEVLAELLGDPPVPSRWGDYSSISVDPADPTQFWTIQTYPSGVDSSAGVDVGIWSTRITQLIVTAPPLLTLAFSGTNAMISWPSSAAGYQLFSATNLAPPVAWTSVTQLTVTNAGEITATVPTSGAEKFFRLQK